MARAVRHLSRDETHVLTELCRDLTRHGRMATEVIAGATTTAQVRQVAAALIHDARLLYAALDAIERADDGGAPGEQEG